MVIFSTFGAWLTLIADGYPFRMTDAATIGVPMVCFILCLFFYYRTTVLRTDLLRELMSLHPEGKELLRTG